MSRPPTGEMEGGIGAESLPRWTMGQVIDQIKKTEAPEILTPHYTREQIIKNMPKEEEPDPNKKELILLGKGPSMGDCPTEKMLKMEVWTSLSCLSKPGWEDRKYDKVFCFDDPDLKLDEMTGLEVAQRRGLPICGNRACCTEKYPMIEIMRHFTTNYLMNDPSFMIALAIYQKYDKLWIYGIDQVDGGYEKGRSYVAFWLGVALGRGIPYKITRNALPWLYSDRWGGY